MFSSFPSRFRSRRVVAWAASLTAVSMIQSALAGRNIQVDRVVRGTATFSSNGSLTTITASNRAVINYSQFNIASGEAVQFVQPTAHSRVLNRINSNNPSMLDGTMTANGFVYFVNPAGVIFGSHSIINANGIVAAAGNISDADFRAGVNHFQASGALVNNGSITGNSVQLVGQSVSNHGSISAPGGLVAMVAGQDVYLGTNGSNILVKVAAGNGGVSNTGSISAPDGQATLVSGDLYSMALGTPSEIKAKQVSIQGGVHGVANVSGQIVASNTASGATGGSIAITGQNVNVSGATIDASGSAGGGAVLIGGNFHGAGPLANAQTTSISSDTTIRANALNRGNGGQVAIWSEQTTNFAGTIFASGADGGAGGFAEISSGGHLNFNPTNIALGGGQLLLDPFSITIQDSNPDINGDGTTGDDITGASDLSDANADFPGANSVITSGALNGILATNNVTLAATDHISDMATATPVNIPNGQTLTLDSPTINLSAPVTGSGTLAGSANVATVNVHANGLINNAITLSQANGTVNIDGGNTYAEDVDITKSLTINVSSGTATAQSWTLEAGSPSQLAGSFAATGTGFVLNDRVTAAGDITFAGPITINNDGATTFGSIDAKGSSITLITSSLTMSPLALIDNVTGTSGQGNLTIQPANPTDSIGIGDTTPPVATLEIDPIDNIGGNFGTIFIGGPTASSTITMGPSTFSAPISIESPQPGGFISVNGMLSAPVLNAGSIAMTAPTIHINAPIAVTGTPVSVILTGDVTLSGNITTERSQISIIGPLTLAADVTLDTTNGQTTVPDNRGDNISLMGIDGSGFSLSMNSGTLGTISVTGAITNTNAVTIINSNGATFSGGITASAFTIDDTIAGQIVDLQNVVNIGALTASDAGNAYRLTLDDAAGGQSSTVTTASLPMPGVLTLGNNSADSITFTNGLNHFYGPTVISGTILAAGQTIQLNGYSTTFNTDSVLTASTILLGDINVADNTTLTMNAGSLTISGVSAAAATVDLNLTGSATIGPDDNNIQAANIDSTTGTINFSGNTTIGTLTTAADPYVLAFTGALNTIGTATLSDTGGLHLGDATHAINIVFNNGLTYTAGTTSMNGAVMTGSTPILLGDATLAGDTTLDTTLEGTNPAGASIMVTSIAGGGNNFTLNSGTAGAILVTATTDNVALLTIMQSDSATFMGTVGAGTSGDITVDNSAANTTLIFNQAANIKTLSLSSATTISGAGPIKITDVAGPTSGSTDLTFNLAGSLAVAGSVSNIGTLTIANSSGATVGSVSVATLVLDQTTGTIAFNNDLTATTLSDTGGNFNLQFLGANTTITNAVTLDTTGTVTFGGGYIWTVQNDSRTVGGPLGPDIVISTTTFTNGVTHTAGPNIIDGYLVANNAPVDLQSNTSVVSNNSTYDITSIIDAGAGSVMLGDVSIGPGAALTVGYSVNIPFFSGVRSMPILLNANQPTPVQSGDIVIATISGASTSQISFDTSGNINLVGAIGSANSPLGGVTVYVCRTATFGGPITTSGDVYINAVSTAGDAGSGDINIADISGSSSSNVFFNAGGDVAVLDPVGSSSLPVGSVTVNNSRTANFEGAVYSSGDISITSSSIAGDTGSGNISLGGDLNSGGNISIQPGTALLAIPNIAGAYAAPTLTFTGTNIIAAGSILLASTDETPAARSGVKVPSVANIIGLGTPTTVNGNTGIALNIQAGANFTMGRDSNLSVVTGGLNVSAPTGAAAISEITALGSIIIDARSVTVDNTDRANWNVLTPQGNLVPQTGILLFAGGQGQPDILSMPDGTPTADVTKAALVLATAAARSGDARVLSSSNLLAPTDIEYPQPATNGVQYYLLANNAELPAPPTPPTPHNVFLAPVNAQYVDKNISIDSAMRKQLWRLGFIGRDTALDGLDVNIYYTPQFTSEAFENAPVQQANQ